MATKKLDTLETFYAPDRRMWRAWLMDNHATATGVWLMYYKKESGKPRVSYDAAVEEALCFGWIDSVANKIDDERYKQMFSPRKPNSNWAASNKKRVERLIAQGLMTEAGMKTITIAQKNGKWNALDDVEQLREPNDLRAALDANPTADTNWSAFSRSVKRGILEWILNAKRPKTRTSRIEETVRLAGENNKANHYTKSYLTPTLDTPEA